MNDLGSALLGWWRPATLWTAGLLAIAVALDVVLARRVRASWRLLLYAAVLVRVFLPIGMITPLGIFGGSAEAALAGGGGTHFQLVGVARVAPTPWKAAVAWVWLAGIVVGVALWVGARIRLARRLRSARPAREAATRLSPRHPVLEHDCLGPALFGLVRPRIVLPSAILDSPGGPDLNCVIAHELAHVRRGDPLATAVLQAVAIVLWPIVPLGLAVRRMRALMELACDELVLDGADADARRRYGESLLAMAGFREVAVGLSFGSGLAGRVRALAAARRYPRWLQAGLVAAAAVALVACAGTRPSPAPARTFSGRRVDLDYKGAQLANLLRLFSDVGQVNILIDDDLAAHPIAVDANYRQTPWDEALDSICRQNGLHWRRDDRTIWVSRAEPPAAHPYTGKHIDFDLADADLRKAMDILAEVGQVKIEVADSVHATVTLRLRDMPWDEVLDSLLWSKGLHAERDGDVIRVR